MSHTFLETIVSNFKNLKDFQEFSALFSLKPPKELYRIIKSGNEVDLFFLNSLIKRITYFADRTSKFKEEGYINGKKEGISEYWRGNPHRLMSVSYYKNGELNGSYKQLYADGTIYVDSFS